MDPAVPDTSNKELKRLATSLVVEVHRTLRRWDPIGARPGELAPTDEYDTYAPHIVSMVVQGCTRSQLCMHLGTLRADALGIDPDPDFDREIADEIFDTIGGSAA